MMNLDIINSTTAPWLYSCSSDLSAVTNFSWKIGREHGTDLSVKLLRGDKMRSWQALFDEIAAALQFPYYFGENLNAFDECVTDLEWLNARGYFLVILKADEVLVNCDEADFQALINHLNVAASEWAKPIKAGQTWDRDARPFHVLFHTEDQNADHLRARLERTNLNIPRLAFV